MLTAGLLPTLAIQISLISFLCSLQRVFPGTIIATLVILDCHGEETEKLNIDLRGVLVLQDLAEHPFWNFSLPPRSMPEEPAFEAFITAHQLRPAAPVPQEGSFDQVFP